MKKSSVFKWVGFGLIAVAVASTLLFVFRTNTFSSRVVLRDEIQEQRVILHNGTGEHACNCFSPLISYFNVTNITATGATFTWDCDVPSTYQVTYGLTSSKGTLSPSATPTVFKTLGSITVTGLTPNTTYHAAPSSICQWDKCTRNSQDGLRKTWLMDNTSQGDWTFKTLASGSTYTISGTVATSTNTGITGVTVTLSGASSSTVTTAAAGTYSFANLATGNYTVTPTKTNYTFSPANKSFVSLSANQTAQNFTGTPTTGVVAENAASAITDVAVAKVTAKDATITWKTSIFATSSIEYGLNTNYGMNTGVSTEMVIDHDIQLFDLQPGATYHYRVVSYADDSKGTAFKSSDQTFTVPAVEERIVDKAHYFNEPNPCSDRTMFVYFLYQPVKRVTIDVLTLSGKLMASLESPSSNLGEGWNKVAWNLNDNRGKPLANGMYTYKIKFETGNNSVEVKNFNLMVKR